MACVWYITSLLLATVVLADYYIDNANTSIVYSMPPSQSGQSWKSLSVGTQSLALQFSNSTGNYTITLDASNCYDQNYALGVCGTDENCFVQIPFTGSGITMYVFNAGTSGMTASFAVDGGKAVSKSIAAPTSAENYQVSNVSMYDIQGLPTGNHTMQMTLLDWNGGSTSMKFDYAYINETFVATPSSATSHTSNRTNLGGVVGATLGGLVVLSGVIISFIYLRRRKSMVRRVATPGSDFELHPFTTEYFRSQSPQSQPWSSFFFQQRPEGSPTVRPLARSAILRDALAAGNYASPGVTRSSQSVRSGTSSFPLQPLRRQPSHSADSDPHARSSVSQVADSESPFSDPAFSWHNYFTAEQVEVVRRLQAENVPAETVARVVEEFMSQRLSAADTNGTKVIRPESAFSSVPPPSYHR